MATMTRIQATLPMLTTVTFLLERDLPPFHLFVVALEPLSTSLGASNTEDPLITARDGAALLKAARCSSRWHQQNGVTAKAEMGAVLHFQVGSPGIMHRLSLLPFTSLSLPSGTELAVRCLTPQGTVELAATIQFTSRPVPGWQRESYSVATYCFTPQTVGTYTFELSLYCQ